jgi:DNA (cytosine-5)-methyltransferase 1
MRSVEIFSGVGGLAKGLENAGFEHVAFVEFNKDACISLRENFGAERVLEQDVRSFSFSGLSAIDVVAGGPPCQPFSLGGKHQASDDSRDMFPHAIRAIEELAPKAFVFENVKGLLRPSFEEYFRYVLARLGNPSSLSAPNGDWRKHLASLHTSGSSTKGVRYDVAFQLVNAADYGVPQTRERVVIVGTRSDLRLEWTFPTPSHSVDRLLWDQFVTGEYWERHKRKPIAPRSESMHRRVERIRSKYGLFAPEGLPWRTIRDVLRDVPDPERSRAIVDHVFKAGARSYPGHTGSDYDWPAKTIKAGGHGVPGGRT